MSLKEGSCAAAIALIEIEQSYRRLAKEDGTQMGRALTYYIGTATKQAIQDCEERLKETIN